MRMDRAHIAIQRAEQIERQNYRNNRKPFVPVLIRNGGKQNEVSSVKRANPD